MLQLATKQKESIQTYEPRFLAIKVSAMYGEIAMGILECMADLDRHDDSAIREYVWRLIMSFEMPEEGYMAGQRKRDLCGRKACKLVLQIQEAVNKKNDQEIWSLWEQCKTLNSLIQEMGLRRMSDRFINHDFLPVINRGL